MKLIYKGKTKDVFELQDGSYLLKFKDDMTGENGVFDPGANTVGLTVDGAGAAGLKLTCFFFEKINAAGIPTQFIGADTEKAEMTVKPATIFGKGLEVICRYRATGSFIRRYGMYIKDGELLNALVEITLKDDLRGDPLITKDSLAALGILSEDEFEILKSLTKKICGIVKDLLAEKGLELYDIKLEFGRDSKGEIMLIDEISGGNMRVYKESESVPPLELARIMTE